MQVPFNPRTGRMESYGQYNTMMRDFEEFEDVLVFKEFIRGRSSVKAVFCDRNNNEWEMFLSDFEKIIPTLAGGRTPLHTWVATKRGSNYAIKPLLEKEIN